jgi:transforming growth factor-beta-induced protein
MKNQLKRFLSISALLLALGAAVAQDRNAPANRNHGGSMAARSGDLIETAVGAGQFGTLAKALAAADLVDTLKGGGPFTVLAPTDAAFAKLPKGTVESLLKPENKSKLQEILKYHVFPGKLAARDVAAANNPKTLSGERVAISLEDGRLRVNNATVQKTDLAASNGLIHVIDEVLLPGQGMGMEMSGPGGSARDLIELAIDRGVPLFNHGQQDACASLYEVATTALTRLPDAQISTGAKKKLTAALEEARGQSASARAWTLRRALDAALASIK